MVRGRTGWVAVLVCCALLALPLAAGAQVEDLIVDDLARVSAGLKFFDYAMCAVSIVAISSGVGAAIAVLTCGKALMTWWSQ